MNHSPIGRRGHQLILSEGVIDCSCGHRQMGIYDTAFGARVDYLEHLVQAVAADNDWPETFTVEGDDTYVGDAS